MSWMTAHPGSAGVPPACTPVACRSVPLGCYRAQLRLSLARSTKDCGPYRSGEGNSRVMTAHLGARASRPHAHRCVPLSFLRCGTGTTSNHLRTCQRTPPLPAHCVKDKCGPYPPPTMLPLNPSPAPSKNPAPAIPQQKPSAPAANRPAQPCWMCRTEHGRYRPLQHKDNPTQRESCAPRRIQ